MSSGRKKSGTIVIETIVWNYGRISYVFFLSSVSPCFHLLSTMLSGFLQPIEMTMVTRTLRTTHAVSAVSVQV